VSYLSKVTYFNLPQLHLAPPLGMTLFEFRQDLVRQGTSPWVPCGVVFKILRLAVLTQYWRVTDRRTGRQRNKTHDDS